MQATLDLECKSQNEAVHLRKKMEGDLNEMEVLMSHVNRQSAESQKVLRQLQLQIKRSVLQLEMDETLHPERGAEGAGGGDGVQRVHLLHSQNTGLIDQKKLESDLSMMSTDLDKASHECRNVEKKAKKAITHVAMMVVE